MRPPVSSPLAMAMAKTVPPQLPAADRFQQRAIFSQPTSRAHPPPFPCPRLSPPGGSILPACSVRPHRLAHPESVPPPVAKSPRADTDPPPRRAARATISSLAHPPLGSARRPILFPAQSSSPPPQHTAHRRERRVLPLHRMPIPTVLAPHTFFPPLPITHPCSPNPLPDLPRQRHWPPQGFRLGPTRWLPSLAHPLLGPAPFGPAHWLGPQRVPPPWRRADRPQRPLQHQPVKPAQHSRHHFVRFRDKLSQGALLLARVGVLAEPPYLIEYRSAFQFWLRPRRAVVRFSDFTTEGTEKSKIT
jgi:hypothetical protein